MADLKVFIPLLTILSLILHLPAEGAPPDSVYPDATGFTMEQEHADIAADRSSNNNGFTRSQKAWALNLGAMGTVMVWGIVNWDYFSRAPSTENEKWFGHDTKEGGADKLGHSWASYAMSHGFAAAYRRFGYSESESQLYGPLSALAVTGIMEIGDSFSADHGFSPEDMAANVVGAGLGWFLLRYPQWGERIDLRWEYSPEFSDLEGDITTDYEHSKYLLAIKAEGFDFIRNPYLKYLELHLGYYTRGYDEQHGPEMDERKRYFYAGAGVNMGRLARHIWETRIFDYVQIPYTYAEVRTSLE
ncbi:MAG: YfiM family protein [Geobacteraceae bacterium]|nr:YfiM family protein [Geobacteraceae bacterium]